MSDWKEVELNDVCFKITDGSHQSPKEYSGGLPMFSVKDMENYGFNYTRVKTISEEDFKFLIKQGCKPSVNDILIAKDGSVLKHVFKVKKEPDYVLLSSIAILKPKTHIINPDYLVYVIKSPLINDLILSNFVSGSGVPRIVLKDFKKVQITLPPLPVQERIAEVLSSLDDKIDLLHRQNKTLEEMAETLFRQWFEKIEAHESTSISTIEDVAIVQNGYSFKSSEFIIEGPDTIEVLKMGHISADGGLRSSPKKDFIKRNDKYGKWILKKRDIILAMTDMKDNVVILGVPALIDQNNKYVLNQRVGRIFLTDDSPIESILILYMQMKDKNFISELQSKGNSGVQVNLGTDIIRQTNVVIPEREFQKEIIPLLDSFFDKLDQNRIQIQKLEVLRDTLLPKLMCGLVKVDC